MNIRRGIRFKYPKPGDVDNFISKFRKMALSVLKKQDQIDAINLRNSKYAQFYESVNKGLGLAGICERDIQYLIFSDLYSVYMIIHEYCGAYKNKQRVDIALVYEGIPDDEWYKPDVAIEIKRAFFLKSGQLNKSSRQSLVNDVIKMKKYCVIPHKYFMQYAITNDNLKLNEVCTKINFEDSVNEIFYKREFRKHKLVPSYFGCFETFDCEKPQHLNMLLWKLCKTD